MEGGAGINPDRNVQIILVRRNRLLEPLELLCGTLAEIASLSTTLVTDVHRLRHWFSDWNMCQGPLEGLLEHLFLDFTYRVSDSRTSVVGPKDLHF